MTISSRVATGKKVKNKPKIYVHLRACAGVLLNLKRKMYSNEFEHAGNAALVQIPHLLHNILNWHRNLKQRMILLIN